MSQKNIIIENAFALTQSTDSHRLLLFLNSEQDCRAFLKYGSSEKAIIVIPRSMIIPDSSFDGQCAGIIREWSGNQSRFSRIKYAFLQGVLQKLITPEDRVVCVLGPSGKGHLDTITVHDLSLSWSEDFPFDVEPLIAHPAFNTVMAVIDIALDIGALGREGKSVGTIFVIGDTDAVMEASRQAVFNAFKGYPEDERGVNRPEVVESLKELAKLDGAIIISSNGIVESAGRHLDAGKSSSKKFRGLGARHRAAAGITTVTDAISIVVSESTGKVTVFYKGKTVSTLEPLISRRLV